MSKPVNQADHLDSALTVALAQALQVEAVPARRRAALRQRIVAAAAAPLMDVVRADEGLWQPLLPGLAIKFLRVDAASRNQSSLWRLDPGARIPSHPHHAEEECIVLEGSVRFGGRDYGRGDFLLARPGLQHDTFDCADGALLYIRSELTEPLAMLARRSGFIA